MKPWRLWLLLLLAVLLPMRVAVAAAMLCPVAGSGFQAELAGSGHPVGHQALDHARAHDHGDAHGDAAADGGHRHAGHDAHAGSDKCDTCSALCSVTPLVSSAPTVAEPLEVPAVGFSEDAAPAPSFLSDGPERPPRTI